MATYFTVTPENAQLVINRVAELIEQSKYPALERYYRRMRITAEEMQDRFPDCQPDNKKLQVIACQHTGLLTEATSNRRKNAEWVSILIGQIRLRRKYDEELDAALEAFHECRDQGITSPVEIRHHVWQARQRIKIAHRGKRAQARGGMSPILYESRESRSGLPAMLETRDQPIEAYHIDQDQEARADYMSLDTPERWLCERKQIDELVQAIRSKEEPHILERLLQRSEEFDTLYLLIEGVFDNRKSSIGTDSLFGVLQRIEDHGIHVVRTDNTLQTCEWLLAKARSVEKDDTLNARVGKPWAAPAEGLDAETRSQWESVCCYPGIGSLRGRKLLEHFGSFYDVTQADPEALTQVDRIGMETAQRLWQAIRTHVDFRPLDRRKRRGRSTEPA